MSKAELSQLAGPRPVVSDVGLWTTPIYRFRIPREDDPGSDELKEIVIDVTGSAPSFTEPSDELKEVLKEIFESDSLRHVETVVEFGAGKLKNVPFILKQGKKVCAVDFKELSENEFTKKNLERCRKYGTRFQKLVFPNPFLSDPKKFDLALLLNVPPVMPVPAEETISLEVLYGNINDGGVFVVGGSKRRCVQKDSRRGGEYLRRWTMDGEGAIFQDVLQVSPG